MRERLSLLLIAAMVCSCEPGGDANGAGGTGGDSILPVEKGDIWRYRVESVLKRADGGDETRVVERVRKYLGVTGETEAGEPLESFEIIDDGVPVERELVRILPDQILACGSLSLQQPGAKPIVFANPVPFVSKGLQGGEDLPSIRFGGGGDVEVVRKIRVIGPEDIEVKAGRFQTIKLLFTGQDGALGIRRTVWFAEGVGIIREEKERFTSAGVLARESHELLAVERVSE